MRVALVLVVAALGVACARVDAVAPPLQIEMSHVDLRVAPDTLLHVRRLRGRMEAVGRRVPYLDDTRSYAVTIESGEIAVDESSLNALMARTLGGDRSNVDRLRLTIAGDGTLRQKGAIDKGLDIPFSARSAVSVTPDGRLRLSTQSVKGFGVPMKPVMKVFGIEMDDLVKVKPGLGVEVRDNDILLDPVKLIPAPVLRGRLSAARIDGDMLVQVFGSEPSPPAARTTSPNRIYWRGGELSFGKLTMVEADLELVDLDPADPFEFAVADWNAQLVAGYSKTLTNKGLRVFMPDYGDVRRGAAPAEPPRR